ncbi:MAG: tRNA preQ1(34) S-adenosylmethionine ribosyltransferase-isomerase QueA [Acidimicrobiales bacterium]
MAVDAFDYTLPEASVAQVPVEPRDSARLLDATESSGGLRHRIVRDLPELIRPGDVIVVNETRVIPARLRLSKPTGGAVEVLLLEEGEDGWWDALVRPGRRLSEGTLLHLDATPAAEVGRRLPDGLRRVRLLDPALPSRAGVMPLPPYITTPLADPERYQTVYGSRPGSAAAPTAGLHLTFDLLDRCQEAGAEVAKVDLTVGLDTFRPVTAERPEDHVMHSERYCVPDSTWKACQNAERVVAVGTTTVRALEAAWTSGESEGRTRLFITPGYSFGVVDVLMTNFHLPRSSLLLMLAAFCGPGWRDIYAEALRSGYRFLSFGDAMIASRAPT